MKKMIVTFCTVLLLATQAPVAKAQEVNAASKDRAVQTVADYRLKVNAKFYALKKERATTQTAKKVETPQPTTEKTEVAVEKPTDVAQEVKNTTQPVTNAQNTDTTVQATSNASTIDAIEQQVVVLTNKERAKYGLPALEMDTALMAAAREKSQDMNINHYFSHTSPTYGSPFDRMKALGIAYKAAGENIAKGQKTAEEVVTAWMNSEGHRANILSKDFTHIGVGYVKEGHIWTQQFIKK